MRPHLSIITGIVAMSALATAQSSGTLRGSIVDDCGRPIEGARLTLSGGRSSVAKSSGAITMAGLPPGWHEARVEAEGLASRTIRFRISGGRVTDLGTVAIGEASSTTCEYYGIYRDAGTVRVVTGDGATEAGMAYRVTKNCPGGCE